MAALEQERSLLLAQEAVLLASLLQHDLDPGQFVEVLRQWSAHQDQPNLATSARRVLAAWEAHLQSGEEPA